MLVKMKPYIPWIGLLAICTKEQQACALSNAIANAWKNKCAKDVAKNECVPLKTINK